VHHLLHPQNEEPIATVGTPAATALLTPFHRHATLSAADPPAPHTLSPDPRLLRRGRSQSWSTPSQRAGAAVVGARPTRELEQLWKRTAPPRASVACSTPPLRTKPKMEHALPASWSSCSWSTPVDAFSGRTHECTESRGSRISPRRGSQHGPV
jgi:hypothetical protein